ncbi:MAG: thiaminase II [Hyphomicrobiales bacterium]|nr:thiaminase II [Hyphomicrobiales bacterium]
MTPFSEDIWRQTAGLRARIFELPFNQELAEGSLSEERFRFYMIQDALYLEQFARALAVAAAKAPDPDARQQFAGSAQGVLVVERELHDSFFRKFGVAPEEAAAAEPTPTCYGYTNFLLAVAHLASYEELVAALLPCFWIYWDVGTDIAKRSNAGNPYQAWIDTYSCPDFGQSVKAVVAIADAAAAAVPQDRRDAMAAAFTRSAQFEWMFWDSAYRLERWPVEA